MAFVEISSTVESTSQRMHSRYNAEIVAGALLPDESRALAKLVLQGLPEEELTRLLTVDNILQKRSTGTSTRKAELIRKRFGLIDRSLLKLIAEGTRQEMMQALLVAAIKHNKLIGDFLTRVIREKVSRFEQELKPHDWDDFLRECEQIDPVVAGWRPSTRTKLGQVVKKCLTEAGYLESARNPTIVPVMLTSPVRQYLLQNNEDYVLSAMDLFA